MPTTTRARAKPRAEAGRRLAPITYLDFVIQVRRRSTELVDVSVYGSPAGVTATPVTVKFPASEAKEIRDSLLSSQLKDAGIGREDAIALGKRLAPVLFPPAVYALLGQSMGRVGFGLRIRLALDSTLVDLPWEYCYRPDRLASDGISGFLLLDPMISLVREAANPRINLDPISGRQQMSFVGTLWDGEIDGWDVKEEFNSLRAALKPVRRYLRLAFLKATSNDAFEAGSDGRVAVLHYSGHCDFDPDGRAYVLREGPVTAETPESRKVYLEDLARSLTPAGPRLLVMSACNSGFWRAVKPLLDAEIPAIIGVNGQVCTVSAMEFFAKVYESLAVGLALDEAVSRARLHTLAWGQKKGFFDWGLHIVYMPSPQAVLFERHATVALVTYQDKARRDHAATAGTVGQMARDVDGMNYGEILSTLKAKRVLILGRFSKRRLRLLETIKARLANHPNRYIPELFTFQKPGEVDRVETVVSYASVARFVIADLSEPKSLPAELQAIVPQFPSTPVIAIIARTARPYALFDNIQRRDNVVRPLLRYRDAAELETLVDREIVPLAEQKLAEIRPGG